MKNKQSIFEIDLTDKWADPQPINEPPPKKNNRLDWFWPYYYFPFPLKRRKMTPTQHINQPKSWLCTCDDCRIRR